MARKQEGETVAVDGSAVILMDDGDETLHSQDLKDDETYVDPAKDSTEDTTETEDDEEPSSGPNGVTAPPTDTDDVQAELLKKSPAELARMYRDLHKVVGRQGRELGDLRTLADNHIRATLAAQTAAAQREAAQRQPKGDAPPALEDKDFFANPKQAIERAIAEHPEVTRLRRENEGHRAAQVAQRMQQNKDAFEKAHPDAGEILADPGFREWVAKDPLRQKMLVAADRNYDFNAGNHLFSTYKEIRAARQPAQQAATGAAKAKTAQAKSAARVPTGGAATSTKASGSEKIYKRADLIRLQINDPDRYEMMGKEIELAYREGRVR